VAATLDINGLLDHYLAVAVAALDPTPGKVFVQPGGEVAWDQCDCDGQAWSRLLEVAPVVGSTKANGMPCGILYWNLQMAVGVLRCVAVVNDRGVAPAAAKITADGHKFGADAANLLQAVVCDPQTVAIVGVTPLGPLGGCAGSEVLFSVRVQACACPEVTP
jgi:hypothetical protein